MVLRTVIGFEKDPPEDVVTLAVAPIDAVTRRIVQSNVTARITVVDETAESDDLKLPEKPIRNLSGLLVFTHRHSDTKYSDYPKYRVYVKARAAGYFDPEPVDFTPPERENMNALELKDLLRIDITLLPRPDFAFGEEATLISGVVVREKKAVKGAKIKVLVPLDEGMANPHPPQTFETRTDERGAFALPLRLPAFSDNEANGNEENHSINGVLVEFSIETRDSENEWQVELKLPDQEVIEGRRRVYKKPIDLNDPDDPDDPELLTI